MSSSTVEKRGRIRQRRIIVRAVCAELELLGYEEVETPILVPSPGLEPAIQAFRTKLIPEMGALPAVRFGYTPARNTP